MTPHQVISLLTQEQTQAILVVCSQFLDVEHIHIALREGLEAHERRQLAYYLSLEFELEAQDTSNSS